MTVQLAKLTGVSETDLQLGTDTKITDTQAKQVSKTPIVSKPAEDNIAIETGSSRTIQVNFTRVGKEDDNALWAENVARQINRWQTKTDGATLMITDDLPNTQGTRSGGKEELKGQVAEGTERVHGYLRNLTLTYSSGSPDVVAGSISLLAGTRLGSAERIPRRDLNYLPPHAPLNGTYVEVSFDMGQNYEPLMQWGDEDMDSALRSQKITGGLTEPFEKLEITLDSKSFSEKQSEREEYIAGQIWIRISGIGTGEQVTTRISRGTKNITMTAYSKCEVIRGIKLKEVLKTMDPPLPDRISAKQFIFAILSSVSWNGEFLFQANEIDARDGGNVSIDVVSEQDVPITVTTTAPSQLSDLRDEVLWVADPDSSVWTNLTDLATFMGAAVQFSQGRAQFVDYLMATKVEGSEISQSNQIAVYEPMDIQDSPRLAESSQGEVKFNSDVSNQHNIVELSYNALEEKDGKTVSVVKTLNQQNTASVIKYGSRPKSYNMNGRVYCNNDAHISAIAEHINAITSDPQVVVKFSTRDVYNESDTYNPIWEPMFPPCSTLLGISASKDHQSIIIAQTLPGVE